MPIEKVRWSNETAGVFDGSRWTDFAAEAPSDPVGRALWMTVGPAQDHERFLVVPAHIAADLDGLGWLRSRGYLIDP